MPTRAPLLVSALVAAASCKPRERDIEPLHEHDAYVMQHLPPDAAPTPTSTCGIDPSGEVAADLTLRGDCVAKPAHDLRVTHGATLTLEPGATIEFAKATSLRVEDGVLIARGTADAPIVLTSGESPPREGDWNGVVMIDATHSGSVLDHVRIELAGGGKNPAALTVVGGAKLTLGTLTMDRNHGAGLLVVPKL